MSTLANAPDVGRFAIINAFGLINWSALSLNDVISHFVHARDAKLMYDGLLNDKERYHAVALRW